MAQYRTGTATFTNGSATVTGVGTAWASNLSIGDYIVRQGTATDTYETYQIGGITNDTTLTLTAPYGGTTASNVAYAAHIDFHPNGAPKFDNGDIETPSILNRWLLDIVKNSEIGTAAALDAQASLTDTTADRLMKVGAFGLGGDTTQGTDLDEMIGKASRIRSIFDPSQLAGTRNVLHMSNIDNGIESEIAARSNGIDISWRGILSGVPTPWRELYHTGNILGTVSQSAGVPTGAIIERGSNSNGEYVKFADGTMICTYLELDRVVNIAPNSYTGTIAVPLPVNMVTSYQNHIAVSVITGHVNGSSSSCTMSSETVSQAFASRYTRDNAFGKVRAKNTSAITIDRIDIHLVAIGRWY